MYFLFPVQVLQNDLCYHLFCVGWDSEPQVTPVLPDPELSSFLQWQGQAVPRHSVSWVSQCHKRLLLASSYTMEMTVIELWIELTSLPHISGSCISQQPDDLGSKEPHLSVIAKYNGKKILYSE